MNYTKSVGEKSTVKLLISFTEQEWKDAINASYLKIRGKYSVPGFRKGKVPKIVLENYYGRSVFYEEAFNSLYNGYYPEILKKERANFTAVGEPELNVEAMNAGEGVVLSAVVPVKPEITIEAYKGLKIKKFEYNVTDADVDAEAKKILESQAKKEEVSGRACKLGDTVNIDFSGSVDGEKFPGGTAEDYDLVLGSGAFIPGFEDGVVGMNKGESRNLSVKFPDDYQSEDLRGKDAAFAVTVNKITEKIYPELTDEFVKERAGAETVADYKARLRARLEKSAAARGRDDTENSILSEISKHAKAEIPDAMLEGEIDKMVEEFEYRLMAQGLKLADYLKYMQLSLEQFRSQFKAQAQPRVLNGLVIDKIIREEKIKAEQSEIDEKLAEQAKSVEKSLEEYKKGLDPRQLDYIENDIIITKLFEFLAANNELYTEGAKPTAKKSVAKKPAGGSESSAEEAKPTAKKSVAKKLAEGSEPSAEEAKPTAKKSVAKKPAAKKENN